MEDEAFTYAMLRRIERAENTSPRLQKLEPRFWERLGEHLTRLRQAFQDQQEEDPTSRRTVVLADELRNTQRLAESIWGFREKKVVQAALAATRKREGTSQVPDHTTAEERELFESVCGVLQHSRDETAITDPFSRRRAQREARPEQAQATDGEAAPTPATPQATPQTARHRSEDHDAGVTPPGSAGPMPPPVATAASTRGTPGSPGGRNDDGPQGTGGTGGTPGGQGAHGAGQQEAQAPPLEGRGGVGASGEQQMELRLVQALADVPLFAGIDLVDYELAKGEIGNLPANAADALSKRGIVRILPG